MEGINKVLRLLQEMMKDEEYARFLGLIETESEEGNELQRRDDLADAIQERIGEIP